MVPLNEDGRLKIDITESTYKIADYNVTLKSETEIGEASETMFNSFKTFFRQELKSILASKLEQAVEATLNENLIGDTSGDLNATLVGEPVFFNNLLAFPLDGR